MTTIGPHRDDLILEVGGRPLREFGSNGQQRGAAVALKLIELSALRAARGTEPALLLDDVFAAFDADRQRRLARRLLETPERAGVPDGAAAGRAAAGSGPAGVAHGRRKGHDVKERRPPATLADALASYLKQSGFSKRMQQAGIVEQWAELVGPQIAAVTSPESVTPDGVLRVNVTTAAWANELSLMTPRILARLNAGRTGRVKQIRWVPLGPGTK